MLALNTDYNRLLVCIDIELYYTHFDFLLNFNIQKAQESQELNVKTCMITKQNNFNIFYLYQFLEKTQQLVPAQVKEAEDFRQKKVSLLGGGYTSISAKLGGL